MSRVIFDAIYNSIIRGVVSKWDSTRKIQSVVADMGDNYNQGEVEHFQAAGFASKPAPGDKTEAIYVAPSGDASKRLCIMVAGDRDKHLQVEEGEVAIYAPDNPQAYIKISGDGSIVINTNGQVKIEDSSGQSQPVARVGDSVVVDGKSGVITSGSSKFQSS